MQTSEKRPDDNSIDGIQTAVGHFVILRVTVLALGETQHFGWWKSQSLSSTGLSFLDRIYPRTKFAAAVRSAARVAQHAHDAAIGRGDVTHLLRSSEKEEALDEFLTANDQDLSHFFATILSNKDELLQILSDISQGNTWPKQSGPVRISMSQWTDIHTLAAVYQQGFTNKTPVYPYFSA